MSNIQKQDKTLLADIQKFVSYLNKVPDQTQLKNNPFANNSKYLPVSHIETLLDELYFGLWETTNFKSQIVVNEVIGSIELRVYHPNANIWITRTGAASVPIQMQKGSGVTEVNKKIHNTLVKDYPHLKSECLKNAAKSLGKQFGRDLNRLFEDTYTPLLKMPEDDPMTNNQAAFIDSLLHNSILSESEITAIEAKMADYKFNEAGECIEYLQKNQKLSLDQELDKKISLDNVNI